MPRGDQRIPFPVPAGGFLSNLPPSALPLTNLYDGRNVIIRDGRLYVRPGFKNTDPTGFGERVMGGVFYKTEKGSKRTLAAGITRRKQFDGNDWIDVTSTPWTGNEDTHARFTFFPTGPTVYAIGVNGHNPTIAWDGDSATDFVLGGGAPIALDVTACANRVIYGNVLVGGNYYPNGFMYSDFNNCLSTPAANIVLVGEGTGTIVAVRNLGEQSFAVYTERGQYVVTALGGVVPFADNLRDGQPGPASPAAVVSAGTTTHYYMGSDGNFYKFDGVSVTCIGNGVRKAVQADVDPSYLQRVHGVFDRGFREIHWWWVPLAGETLTGGISFNIDNQIWSPIHRWGQPISAAFEWDEWYQLSWNDLVIYPNWAALGAVYPTWDSMATPGAPATVLGAEGGCTYLLNASPSDDGAAIDAYWIYPVKPLGGEGFMGRVEQVEAFFAQTSEQQTVNILLGTANRPGGTISYEPPQTFDLSQDVLPLASYRDVEARFHVLKVALSQLSAPVEFYGALPYLYKKPAGSSP